jgi:alkylated DNA nucleotide flippase Atl1
VASSDAVVDDLVERVLAVVEQIPPGRVLAYGDVAELAGGLSAQDVGQVLRRHGDRVPWWRVLRADGTPAPHLHEQQLSLLRAEQTPMVPFAESVDMARARWGASPPQAGEQASLFE